MGCVRAMRAAGALRAARFSAESRAARGRADAGEGLWTHFLELSPTSTGVKTALPGAAPVEAPPSATIEPSLWSMRALLGKILLVRGAAEPGEARDPPNI